MGPPERDNHFRARIIASVGQGAQLSEELRLLGLEPRKIRNPIDLVLGEELLPEAGQGCFELILDRVGKSRDGGPGRSDVAW